MKYVLLPKFLLSVSFLFINGLIFSQNLLEGIVKDQKNDRMPYANIFLTKTRDSTVLSFTISDQSGNYVLKIDSDLDSLLVHASFIGYRPIQLVIKNKSQTLDLVFWEHSHQLKEVTVKSPNGIHQRGDTINYLVDTFKDQTDHVIADVIKKLPGINVDKEGRISYQGKPIQKYYIEGLDLLEGKYNLANNNLPADAVSRVQIMENHQPIKVLNNLVFSDRASLNIKLKKNVTYTGVADLGTGLRPFLWAGNMTPMLFAKRQQMITSYQTNNIGRDVSRQLRVLTVENLTEQLDAVTEKDWLSIQQLQTPSFAEERWLNNNIHFITSNYARRLKKECDLKLSASYLSDYQQQVGNTSTTLFTATDTIRIKEEKKNKLFFNSLHSGIILEQNTKQNYLKNNFEFSKHWNSQYGDLNNAGISTTQQVNNPVASFRNRLTMFAHVGKKLLTFNSTFNFVDTPQQLTVSPGAFTTLFNEGKAYSDLKQILSLRNTYTNNSVSFRQIVKRVSMETKTGFIYHRQAMQTTANKNQNGAIIALPTAFSNATVFEKTIPYINLSAQYEHSSLRIELKSPVKYNVFNIQNRLSNIEKQSERLTFEPSLSIIKRINSFWQASVSSGITNTFGGLDKLYEGYLLTSYRNVQRNDSTILRTLTQSVNFDLSHRDVLRSLFFNSSYSYSHGTNNLLFSSSIQDSGSTTVETIERLNGFNSHNATASASKLFSHLKTNVNLESNLTISNTEQILNDLISDVQSVNFQFGTKAYSELTDWMIVKYDWTISQYSSKVNDQRFNSIVMHEHEANTIFFPKRNQHVQLGIEYFQNNLSIASKNVFFLNIKYQYSILEKKIDIEGRWINVLNTKQVSTISSDSFYYISDTYELRPSQILFTVKFRL